MKKLEEIFASTNEYFHAHFSSESSPDELIGLYNEIKEKLLTCDLVREALKQWRSRENQA